MMVIRVVPGSAKIKLTKYPAYLDPSFSGDTVEITRGSIEATGSVTLTGDAGDNPANWTLGFIQAKWISTDWVYYRGQYDNHGSIFIQRARPPSRPTQVCRDCIEAASKVFYNTKSGYNGTAQPAAGAAFPIKLDIKHYDKPRRVVDLIEKNGKTQKSNFLRELQIEHFFCTVLSLRDPAGNYQHLSSFYWNERWQYEFQPSTFTSNPVPKFTAKKIGGGNGAGLSGVIDGTPTDHRFTGILTSSQTKNCNDIARAAIPAATADKSANRHEAERWAGFDVRKA